METQRIELDREEDKNTNLRVSVSFDVSMVNNTEAGAAAFAKSFQDLLKKNDELLSNHLQSKQLKVRVQARRNRKPRNKKI